MKLPAAIDVIWIVYYYYFRFKLRINKTSLPKHCGAQAHEGAMKVKVISILEDNYMYLVIEEQSKLAIAVDPAVPHRVRP